MCEDGVAGAGSSYMGSDSSVAFGSVDNVAVPMSSSPAAVSSIKSESVGTVLAVLFSSAASPSAPAPKPHPKVDPKKIFQPSTRSSTTTTSPTPMSAGMPSPRMGPPLLLQPVPVPGWPGYYYPYPGMAMDQQYVQYPQQWMPQPVPPKHHPQEVPPDPPMSDMPTSPRAQPAQLHPPGTPTLTPAIPNTGHPPHTTPSPHTHTTSLSNASSPPSTPLSTTAPGGGLGRLNSGTSTFVPWKVTIKDGSGLEVDLERFKKAGPVVSPPVMVPSSPARKTVVRMETPEAKAKRLAEENEKERSKKEAEKAARRAEKNKRKRERKKAEKACLIKEAARNIEEAKAEVPEESKVEGTPEAEEAGDDIAREEVKDTVSNMGSLCVDTAVYPEATECRPSPLDISGTTGSIRPLPSVLATTRTIKDLGSIVYPEGIKSPNAELNVNAKQGEFRYDREFLLQFMDICHEKPDSQFPLDAIGRKPAAVLHSTGKLETSVPTIAAMTAVSQKDAYQHNTSKSKYDLITQTEAEAQVDEDCKEFFSVRDLNEAEVYFMKLPKDHRWRLVDTIVMSAIESKEADAQLVANLFERAASRDLCSPASFEKGFQQAAEILDDIGAHLDEECYSRLASKSMDRDKLLSLLASDVPQSRIELSLPLRSTFANDARASLRENEPMSDADAYAMVCDDAQELFSLLDMRAETYFSRLPGHHHWRLVDKLVSAAITNESDAQLVAALFDRAASRRLCAPASFEAGFAPVAQALDYIAMSAPRALDCMAMMMKGAHIHEDYELCERLGGRSRSGGILLSLLAS
ncbi:hypothetical protein A0H81_10317 [Grifola frondosa]|uniref:MI domain-containing protein n=1 Tax=Grifola frondosa TaxID=5627 RepID=A0A1C7LYS2_GRIFR|nr:hypothetical protein A0H81_10317 [Grifola frondosa]